MIRYKEVMEFMEENHRNPSKHQIEKLDMQNWLKANRKVKKGAALMNDG